MISFPLSTIWFFVVAQGVDFFSLSTSNYSIEFIIAFGFVVTTFFQWKYINKSLFMVLKKRFKLWHKD